jgi:hypothetical protein
MTYHDYQTVSQAVNELQKRGYTTDFNLEENLKSFETGKRNADDYVIVEVHRYEGNSDPGDEAVVYAIESLDKKQKGILVSGYGISAGRRAQDLISKLHTHQD